MVVCFFSSLIERFPHFRNDPIGVVQNALLVVTSNYRARARGLPKTGAVGKFQIEPKMRFIGSNMRRYRTAMKQWLHIFQSYNDGKGTIVQKKSIDESLIDLTELCKQRIKEKRLMKLVPHRNPEELVYEFILLSINVSCFLFSALFLSLLLC